MAEVGKRHDPCGRDAHHLLQYEGRTACGLQRLREHHDVERPTLEVVESGVDVALDDRDPTVDARVKAVRRDLDTVTVATTDLNQVLQQRAVAAAQVQHPRTGGHHSGHQGQIRPQHPPPGSWHGARR